MTRHFTCLRHTAADIIGEAAKAEGDGAASKTEGGSPAEPAAGTGCAAYAEFLEKHPVYFFGPGAEKCKGVITHPNAHFIDGIVPLASDMLPLAERAFREGKIEDTAYFTPFYLKDFKATVARDKLRM